MAIEFSRVKTRRAFEEVIAQVAERIRYGDLRVGDRLPGERVLADQMGVSRPTIREAIRLLAEAGIVDVQAGPGGGLFVKSDFVPFSLVPTGIDLRASEIASVLEARRMLEPRVAQLAAIRAGEEDFAAMAETIEQQRKLAADFRESEQERAYQLDVQFHRLLARATRNPTVIRLMNELLRDLSSARNVAEMRVVPEWGVDIHERTLHAIQSGNMRLIDTVMDEHLSRTEELWERATGKSLVPGVPDFLKPLLDRESEYVP
jgi:GntR family transcriptional regulator, transcriptional repressor for pyruvate dehydrogenase complex